VKMKYRDYEIDLEQVEPEKWKAHIRRIDGRPISTTPYGPDSVPVISTLQFYDKDSALKEAKKMIENGHMH
jgi:hypothetical protein